MFNCISYKYIIVCVNLSCKTITRLVKSVLNYNYYSAMEYCEKIVENRSIGKQ
jgi:hypothetical protein